MTALTRESNLALGLSAGSFRLVEVILLCRLCRARVYPCARSFGRLASRPPCRSRANRGHVDSSGRALPGF